MNRVSAIAFVLSTLLGTHAFGQTCPYVVTTNLVDAAGTTPTVSCINTGPDAWRIVVSGSGITPTTPGGVGFVDIDVSGGTASSTCDIEIDVVDSGPLDGVVSLKCRLQLGTFFSAIGGNVDSVQLADSVFDTGLVIQDDSRILGSLGYLSANAIAGQLNVGGNVGTIIVRNLLSRWGFDELGDATTWQIDGDLTDGVYVEGGGVTLAVVGSVGTTSQEAYILFAGKALSDGVSNVDGFRTVSVGGDFFADFANVPDNRANQFGAMFRFAVGGDLHGDSYIGNGLPTTLPVASIGGDLAGELTYGSVIGAPGPLRSIQIAGSILPTGVFVNGRWTSEPPVLDVTGSVQGEVILGELPDAVNPGTAPLFGTGTFQSGSSQTYPTEFAAGSVLRIRGEAEQDSVINIDADFAGSFEFAADAKFNGQIIVYNDDPANPQGNLTGSGTLRFNTVPIALQPFPLYDNLSAEFCGTSGCDVGEFGGAIGAVPFAIHGTDSFPARSQLIELSTNMGHIAEDEVRVRYYGPIRLGPTDINNRVVVERKPFTFPAIWTEVPFNTVISVSVSNPRDLLIHPDPAYTFDAICELGPGSCGTSDDWFGPDYRYRIRVLGDGLLCSGNDFLDLNDVPALDTSWGFQVRTKLDRDGNGLIQSNDVVLQVTDPVDVNGDTTADVLDLTEIIHAIED